MKFLALDLEMAQPSRKIIEIGMCIGDSETGKILSKRSLYVNPHEALSEFIIDLTGITQDQVDAGTTLLEAVEALKREVDLYQVQTRGRTVVWGQGDIETIKEQLGPEYADMLSGLFGRRCIDTKTLFQVWRIAVAQPIQGGLAKSMTKLGLAFKGRKHCGADDAENTLRTFFAMLLKFRK